MKLTISLLLLCLLQVSATVYSQNTKFDFSVNNQQILDVLKEIEETSNFRFFYQREQVDVERQVSINVADATVESILYEIFDGHNIDYEVLEDDLILLKPVEIKAETFISQSQLVTGVVTNENGEPIPGVTVVVKGTTKGIITDIDGNYSINVESEEILLFSFVGMRSQEVAVGNQTNINVELVEDLIGIEEVIAIGYGVQKKTTVTGAISTVKGEELAAAPVPNISQALAGRLAGVSMRPQGGQPGFDDPDIYIRGVVTTGNSDPLIVVDGVKRDNIRQIDPNSIETVTILKDASAVAPYGIGGANGVILITTKKGQAGRPVVRLNASYGIQNPTYLPDMLSAKDYMELANEAALYLNPDATGVELPYLPELVSDYNNSHADDPDRYPDSNFLKHWDTNVPVQNYNLEASGGTETMNYHAGIGYFDQGGIFDNVSYKRYSYNMSLGVQATNTTKVTMSLRGSIEETNELDPGEDAGGSLFRAFYKFVPTSTLLYSDGEHWGEHAASSPIAALRSDGYDLRERNTLLTSLTVEQDLPFIQGLNFKGVFSYDPNTTRRKRWHIPFTYHTIDYSTTPYTFSDAVTTQEGRSATYAYLQLDENRSANYTYQAFLNYNRTFGDHAVTGLLVAEARNSTRDNFWTRRNNFSLYIDEMDFGSSSKDDYSNGGASSTGSELGYVYRVTYSYKDRYMLEASGRYDGHYYFAPGSRWGYFPAFSAAWRISEEGFMAGLDNVDNMKLRASWGQSGMLAGSAFQYLSGYNLRGNAYAFGNGVLVQGSRNEQEANPNITWERATKLDIGFDLNMWNGLLNLELDYFHEDRTDMLLAPQVTLPEEYGLSLSDENKGEMKNDGFELNIGSNYNVNNDLRIGITGNVSYSKNQMIEVFQSDAQAESPNRTRVGKPLNTPFGYKAIGLATTDMDINSDGVIDEADGYMIESFADVHPGDIMYADISGPEGIPDGKIDINDETKIGHPERYPLLTFGLTTSVDWKGLDVSLFFQGSAMSSINTYQFQTVPFENNGSNTAYEYFDNRWLPERQNAKYPRATPSPYTNNTPRSTFWQKNTGFIRLKTAIIGYTLPSSIVDKIGIGGVRFYLTTQNLFTFSKLKHVDPEMASFGRETSYPVMKNTTFGVDITF